MAHSADFKGLERQKRGSLLNSINKLCMYKCSRFISCSRPFQILKKEEDEEEHDPISDKPAPFIRLEVFKHHCLDLGGELVMATRKMILLNGLLLIRLGFENKLYNTTKMCFSYHIHHDSDHVHFSFWPQFSGSRPCKSLRCWARNALMRTLSNTAKHENPETTRGLRQRWAKTLHMVAWSWIWSQLAHGKIRMKEIRWISKIGLNNHKQCVLGMEELKRGKPNSIVPTQVRMQENWAFWALSKPSATSLLEV